MAKRGERRDPGQPAPARDRSRPRKHKRRELPESRAVKRPAPPPPDPATPPAATPAGAPPQGDATPASPTSKARSRPEPAVAGGKMRVIEPPARGLRRYLSELGRHSPAMRYFIRRYVRKRTQRTFLGYFWFVIPIVMPLIMGTLVFGSILGVKIGTIPYFLFFTIATGTWMFFAQGVYFSTRSLEMSRKEIRRVYVPRLAVLLPAVTIPSVSLIVYFVIAAIAFLVYYLSRGTLYLVLSASTLLVPVALLMLVVLAWSWSMWTAPLAPRARDVRRFTNYSLGMLFYITPVIYPIQNASPAVRTLINLNPVTSPIEMVKHGILGPSTGSATALGLISWAVAVVGLGIPGILSFSRKERRDVVFY